MMIAAALAALMLQPTQVAVAPDNVLAEPAPEVAAPSARVEAVAELARAVIETTRSPAAAIIVVGPDGPLAVEVAGRRKAGGTDQAGADDAWHIGSNGKAMTATLAMTLAEDGVISLDDTVGGVLGDDRKVHDDWYDVTLGQLLSHRGGMAPNPGRIAMIRFMAFGAEAEADIPKDRQAILRPFLRRPPATAVGAFAYSNLGYALAGEMLQARGGESFEVLMRQRVFEPLGMDGAIFGAPTDATGRGAVLRGHRGGGVSPAPEGADNPLAISPAGTMSFPAAAYAAFLTDQLRGQMELPGTLLTPASYAAMATPPGGEPYGLGWGVRDDGSLGHSGSNTMWFATASIRPKDGIAIAVLTNYGEATELGPFIDEAAAAFAER